MNIERSIKHEYILQNRLDFLDANQFIQRTLLYNVNKLGGCGNTTCRYKLDQK